MYETKYLKNLKPENLRIYFRFRKNFRINFRFRENDNFRETKFRENLLIFP
jgi:hypothetical protein